MTARRRENLREGDEATTRYFPTAKSNPRNVSMSGNDAE